MRNKIYFRLPIGIGYEVDLREKRSIKEIIKCHPTSYFADPQKIKAFCQNEQIDLNQTLQANNITPNSIVHLNFSELERQPTNIEIKVFYESNLLFFSMKYGCKVKELKNSIKKKLKFPIQEQILVFQGKKLGDEEQLTLPQNSIISLVKTGQDLIEFDMQVSQIKKFQSIKFENKKSSKKFMMKSLGFKSIKKSLKKFYEEYGPSQISEEDGYQIQKENLHQSQKINSFLMQELGQEIVLCDSEEEDDDKEIKLEEYRIEILEKATNESFILKFKSSHTFEYLKTVISSLISSEENFVLVCARTKKVITCMEQILEELKEITIPAFLIEE